MTEATANVAAAKLKERGTKSFRWHKTSTQITVEQSRRQNNLLQSAWRNLGERGAVIAFLNTHNEHLGGQPLGLALSGDEGLLRVERLLQEQRSCPSATPQQGE